MANVALLKNGKLILKGNKVVSGPNPALQKPLCFTANTAGSTVELIKVGSPSIANTAYSLDGQTWTTFEPSTTVGTNTITLANAGDKVYFRNDILTHFSSSYLQFKMSGSIAASGNCNSIYDAINFDSLRTLIYTGCYKAMFQNCTSLTTAPALPATTLADECYVAMFHGCTSLTTAPALPATTLATSCYSNMFHGCTSLITAPVLPATTLANNCYYEMFYNCTSLKRVPMLPATTLKSYCYYAMFCGCRVLQVSDSQTARATYQWKIPQSGTFTNTSTENQVDMFAGCAGNRSDDTMPGVTGQSYTYYTQYEPI